MSGEAVAYYARQNKYVERQLFLEMLSYIDRVQPIRDYLYVGFGGPYLEDFKLMHSSFGSTLMLSLEREEWVHRRQKFNLPIGCLICKHLTSRQFVERYDEIVGTFGDVRVITWFDFASPRELSEQIADFQALLRNSGSMDIVKLTLNANLNALYQPCTAKLKEAVRAQRFSKLKARLKNLLPSTVTADAMNEDEYPRVLLKALHLAAAEAMKGSPKLLLQPLNSFTYADGEHRMFTFTGIVLEKEAATKIIDQTGIHTFQFNSLNWDSYTNISIPSLSPREKLHLDQIIFQGTTREHPIQLHHDTEIGAVLAKSQAGCREEAGRYFQFYRYYPHFHPIEY